MSNNKELVAKIVAVTERTTNIAEEMFKDEIKELLAEAVADFNLAPDPWADVARLPSSVKNLTTLVSHLGTIKEQISKRDSKTKNEDWEVAKSGDLRKYKLFVCCIHALNGYIKDEPTYDVDLTTFISAVMQHAASKPPAQLETGATKLWNATFVGKSARTISVMKALLYFVSEEAGPPPSGDAEDDAKA